MIPGVAPLQAQLSPYNSTIGRVPEQGPKAADLSIVFTAQIGSFQKELFQEQSKLLLDFVQSVYVDNSANANPFTLSIAGTVFSITVKPHTQGFYPIDVPEGAPTFQFTTTAAAVTVNLVFYNFMLPYVNWATQ